MTTKELLNNCFDNIKEAIEKEGYSENTTDVIEGITELAEKIKNRKVKFPSIHGTAKDTILKIIEHIKGGSIYDIQSQTNIKLNTIRQKLTELIKDGEIERSDCKPSVYYIKGKNYALLETLKNVKHRKEVDSE